MSKKYTVAVIFNNKRCILFYGSFDHYYCDAIGMFVVIGEEKKRTYISKENVIFFGKEFDGIYDLFD